MYSGSTRNAIGTSFGSGSLCQSTAVSRALADPVVCRATHCTMGFGCVFAGSTKRMSQVETKLTNESERKTNSGSSSCVLNANCSPATLDFCACESVNVVSVYPGARKDVNSP